MIFNSLEYALFLPVVVIGHWILPSRLRLAWLVAASYVFYAAWDWRFLSLLLISTVTDYAVGRLLAITHVDKTRKLLLLVSIVVNMGLLGFFKYFNFFVDSAQDLLATAGLESSATVLQFALPVGISFYTFQTLSYTIDVYRRDIEPCRDPILFATFVAFFPQLVAGPIERAKHLLPQLAHRTRPPGGRHIESGLLLILLGLFKKVVIADQLAPLANDAFGDPEGAGTMAAAFGVLAFALQIYGDFSGYTDIARGSSRLLSVELIHNFRQPYLSRNISEFWRRWHISLSQWLRDYLYIPLGGNRSGDLCTYRNLMITMLLGGLWHGASWTFVAWGGLHGLYLAVHRWYRPGAPITNTLPRTPRAVAATLATFGLVCFAWIFFRSDSIGTALAMIGELVSFSGPLPSAADTLLLVFGVAATLTIDIALRTVRSPIGAAQRHPVTTGVLAGVALVALIVASGDTGEPFIYFQF